MKQSLDPAFDGYRLLAYDRNGTAGVPRNGEDMVRTQMQVNVGDRLDWRHPQIRCVIVLGARVDFLDKMV